MSYKLSTNFSYTHILQVQNIQQKYVKDRKALQTHNRAKLYMNIGESPFWNDVGSSCRIPETDING